MAENPKDVWRPEDDYGIGANADGVVQMLSLSEYRQRLADRDAQEGDDLPEEDLDDVSDLEDDDGET